MNQENSHQTKHVCNEQRTKLSHGTETASSLSFQTEQSTTPKSSLNTQVNQNSGQSYIRLRNDCNRF